MRTLHVRELRDIGMDVVAVRWRREELSLLNRFITARMSRQPMKLPLSFLLSIKVVA